jgi:1-acyl-sn-glycerol-3-phosphate acyltransferase
MNKIIRSLYLLYATLIFIGLMFVALPFVLIFSTLLPTMSGKKWSMFCLKCWALGFSILSFFWVKTINSYVVDTTKSHIYIGNHGSYLDAIAVCISLPQFFSPLGKIEMAKIPVFGTIYSRVVVMIDRSDKESREKSVNVLKTTLENGQSILIFPEGTMNKTNAPLGDFYDGAFRIAIETQTPLMPFVMINNKTLLPRIAPLKVRPGIIKTIFLGEIAVGGLTLDDLPSLKEKAHRLMEKEILKHSNPEI